MIAAAVRRLRLRLVVAAVPLLEIGPLEVGDRLLGDDAQRGQGEHAHAGADQHVHVAALEFVVRVEGAAAARQAAKGDGAALAARNRRLQPAPRRCVKLKIIKRLYYKRSKLD